MFSRTKIPVTGPHVYKQDQLDSWQLWMQFNSLLHELQAISMGGLETLKKNECY